MSSMVAKHCRTYVGYGGRVEQHRSRIDKIRSGIWIDGISSYEKLNRPLLVGDAVHGTIMILALRMVCQTHCLIS